MDMLSIQLPWESAMAGAALSIRALAFVSIAPLVGGTAVPARVRVAFAVMLVLLLAPVVPAPDPSVGLVRLVLTESLVGFMLGFAGRMVIDAALYAGGVASYSSGLAIANQLDPITQLNLPMLGVLYRLLGILTFLAIGGHRQFVAVLARSYTLLPVGTANLEGPWVASAVSLTGRMIVLGVRLAAPVIVSGLLVDTALMLVARAVPQMHILVVGAPIRLGFGLLAVGLSLQILLPLIVESIDGSMTDAGALLRALGG
ncbi:MAG TPA: type III secretion protein [Acidobacteria bacterium]|nr:type III secretion protein [Acidobacteriota bacterium]